MREVNDGLDSFLVPPGTDFIDEYRNSCRDQHAEQQLKSRDEKCVPDDFIDVWHIQQVFEILPADPL